MGDNKISEAVVRLACDAYDKVAQWGDVTNEFEAMNAALEAALPHLQGEAVPVGNIVAWTEKDGDEWVVYDADSDTGRYIAEYSKNDHYKSVFPIFDHPQPAELSEQHPDDLAVDTFANAMKSKMTISRWRGRSGWDDRSQCSQSQLSAMLRAHVEKGDPVDVANFCMMLSLRGEGIESAAGLSEVSGDSGEVQALKEWIDAYHIGQVYDKEEIARQTITIRNLRAALAATGKQQVGECTTASAMLGEEERPRSPVQMADALERIAGGALADYEGCEADELHILRCAKLIRDLASRQPATVNESDYADLPDIFDGRDAGTGVGS